MSRDPLILWCGRFHEQDGYGTGARLHVNGLRGIGAPVVAVDMPSLSVVGEVSDSDLRFEAGKNSLRITCAPDDRPIIAVVHERPDEYPRVSVAGRARVVGYSYWEAVSLPEGWAGFMASMDGMLTSSDFNAETFSRGGVPSWLIQTIGHPIDPLLEDVRRSATEHRRRWQEQTVFLSVASSAVGRRDLTMLFESYAYAFDHDDDVALIIKVPPRGIDAVQDCLERTMLSHPARGSGRWPTVYTIAERLSREQLARLHASVDAYVSCERGNGWDLPAMDSMTLGIPVVNVGFGASTMFCSSGDTYTVPVGTTMVACDDSLHGPHPLYSGQFWPYVDPHDLADQLRSVHQDPVERRRRGNAAAERLRDTYSPNKVAQELLERLFSVQEVDYRASSQASVTVSTEPIWTPAAASRASKRDEAALLGLLSEPGFMTPSDPRKFFEAYKNASTFAKRRARSLSGTKSKKLMSASMAVSTKTPLKKGKALLALRAHVHRRAPSFGGSEALREDAKTIVDYYDTVAGRDSVFGSPELEERRRGAWLRYGPVRTPAADLDRLRRLRDRHLGERVFILGNGPSLARCDLDLLAGERTFGVDKIYLLFDQLSWRPDYYTLIDWAMGAAVADGLGRVEGMTRFYPERFRGVLPITDDTYWYWPRDVGEHINNQFEPNVSRGIPSSATVLVTAIQQAFFLGFRDIYLVGVDAEYDVPASVEQSRAEGVDVDGQDDGSWADYDTVAAALDGLGENPGWHDTTPLQMRRMLRIMRRGVEWRGGRLINATIGGSLEELPRVDYGDLF